jgi:hypothetical protein
MELPSEIDFGNVERLKQTGLRASEPSTRGQKRTNLGHPHARFGLVHFV